MKDYLICYDISDKKRLARLARVLEKNAMRIQESIFLLSSAYDDMLCDIIEMINCTIDLVHDDVRIYTILDHGISLGQAINLKDPFIFD